MGDEDIGFDYPPCPHCGSDDVEFVSYFGVGNMTVQFSCRDCNGVFESPKWRT